jgi:heme exporter protein CcmD
MSEGVVVGGWEYVWLAYSVTGLVLGGYAVSVYLRYRAEKKRRRREEARSAEVAR